MDIVIYLERISRYLEEEYHREFRSRRIGIHSNRRIFSRFKKEVWERI